MNKEILHLRELIEQHQRLTSEALQEHRALTKLLADERHESNLLNVKTALESLNERILKLNELRAQLQDVINTLETETHSTAMSVAINQRVDAVVKEVDLLKLARSNDQGKGQILQIIWALVASIIVVLIREFFKK